MDRVFFTSGGSESVEAAWKLAREHFLAIGQPQRTKAIARDIAYHGVTLGALSFTGVERFKEPFGRRRSTSPTSPTPTCSAGPTAGRSPTPPRSAPCC